MWGEGRVEVTPTCFMKTQVSHLFCLFFSVRSNEIPAEVVNLLVFMEDFLMYSKLPRKVGGGFLSSFIVAGNNLSNFCKLQSVSILTICTRRHLSTLVLEQNWIYFRFSLV